MAHTFVDRFDRTWNVALDFAAAKRIDDSNFANVTDLKDWSFLRPSKELFGEIISNPKLLMALVWAVVQPQVKDRLNLDPMAEYEQAELEFLRGIDGDTYTKARTAFCEALASFFHEAKNGLLILVHQRQRAVEKLDKELAGVMDQATAFIDGEIDKEIGPLKEALEKGDAEAVKAILAKR